MKKKWTNVILASLAMLSIIMLFPQNVDAASWKKNRTGWWYEEDNGSYPKSTWKKINGKWYYFDKKGYMTTGWQKVGGKWYYMNRSGAMLTGWQKVGSYWYYMYADGHMAASTWVGKYYVNSSGRWVTNMQPAKWMHNSRGWWYRHTDGSWSVRAWEKIKGIWYYFDGSGYMVTGWNKINGEWYYMHKSGAMAYHVWVGDYYLKDSGAMATSQWVGDYYVGADGKWIPNYQDNIKAIKVVGLSKMTLKSLPLEGPTAVQKLVVVCDPGGIVLSKDLQFKSSDESVATVDSLGLVKAVKEGKVTITVQYKQFAKDFAIEVEKIPVESVTLGSIGQMNVGDLRNVYAFVLPLTATYRDDVVFTSSDENIATVDAEGMVTGIAPGNVTITATVDGVSNFTTITVNAIADLEEELQPEKSPDMQNMDINAANTDIPNAGAADTNIADANIADANIADTNTTDANIQDMEQDS